VPEEQMPVFHLAGPCGGWFLSLLWGNGDELGVTWADIQRLLSMRDGSVILARRLTAAEEALLIRARAGSDRETHARIIRSSRIRWQR
jgi:hypothetical protein